MRRSVHRGAWVLMALMVLSSTGMLFAEGQAETLASEYQVGPQMETEASDESLDESLEALPYGYGYGYRGSMGMSGRTGMMGRSWDRERSQYVEADGILVSDVLAESPAAQAGLQRGDIILKIDSKVVNSVPELNQVLLGYEHGQAVVLQVKRGEESMNVNIQLESRVGRPLIGIASDRGALGAAPSDAWTGPMGRIFGGQLFQGFRGSQGSQRSQERDSFSRMFPQQDQVRTPLYDAAVVVEVVKESPAELAGLKAGALIVAVDGQVLEDGDLVSAIMSHDAGDTVTLTLANGETLKVSLGDVDGKAYLGVMYHVMGDRWDDMVERFAPRSRMGFPDDSDL